MSSSSHRVKIAARLRPRLNGEQDDGAIIVDTQVNTITVPNPRDPSQVFNFPFTSAYNQSSTQHDIFIQDVQPMIDVLYTGVTVTIFAYGVTSSGKTHTMQGTKADPGVIPRVVREMFAKGREAALSMSYMEIYKDEVYDLLDDTSPSRVKLPVRENDVGQVFVANLSTRPISSVNEFDTIYNRAAKLRSVGSTNLNNVSSRSHAVLTIHVQVQVPGEQKTLAGKINLVDLAGSENNKLTGNDPSRMAESSAINKSLSVLGQVVHALNQGASRIPYRNSKLTRILQDALGGSSIGLLICNLAPGNKFRQDTLNTLNFAVRTKNVENKPVINERDNRPAFKPHFAAVATTGPPPKLLLADALPDVTNANTNGEAATNYGNTNYSRSMSSTTLVAAKRNNMPRSSMSSMALAQRSRVPRISMAFGGTSGYRPSIGIGLDRVREAEENGSGSAGGDRSGNSSMGLGIGMTEKEIDERISRAVEVEVARRLAEREAELRQHHSMGSSSGSGRNKSRSPKKESLPLPSGVLTPLLKRHKDLDDELKQRLEELETKYERGNREVQLADVLSPVSKKKTGRAYVALARAHSEKGDLQVALDLYRKAENYVPDNVKLKERIIEIEWAVKNDRAFIPSPKRARKEKARRKGVRAKKVVSVSVKVEKARMDLDEEYADEEEEQDVENLILEGKEEKRAASLFGTEVTNINNIEPDSPTKIKRSMSDLETEENAATPPKRQRRGGRKRAPTIIEVNSDDEDGDEWVPVPVAPAKKGASKKGKRKVAA